MNLNNAAPLKCGVLNLKYRPADAEDLQPNEVMNKRALVAPPVIATPRSVSNSRKTQLTPSNGVYTQKTGKARLSRPRALIRAERAVQNKKANKFTDNHTRNTSFDTSIATYVPFHLEKRPRPSDDQHFLPAAAFLAALNSPISSSAVVQPQSLSTSSCNALYAPSRPPVANEEDVSFVGPIIRALAQVTTTQADASFSWYHAEEDAFCSFHCRDEPGGDPDPPKLLLYDQENLPLESKLPLLSPARPSTSDPLIKEERLSPDSETRSSLIPFALPDPPSIKEEPPEALTLASRTQIMSGTHRVFPLPRDCVKASRQFNRNRARWAKTEIDNFRTEFRSKSRRWNQKHPSAPEVALTIDRWMIREDGLIIDWCAVISCICTSV